MADAARKAFYANGERKGPGFTMADSCDGQPNADQLEAAFVRIFTANPDWSTARIRQRAIVEAYKGVKL